MLEAFVEGGSLRLVQDEGVTVMLPSPWITCLAFKLPGLDAPRVMLGVHVLSQVPRLFVLGQV